jgi:hypothetical protein
LGLPFHLSPDSLAEDKKSLHCDKPVGLVPEQQQETALLGIINIKYPVIALFLPIGYSKDLICARDRSIFRVVWPSSFVQN